MQCRKEKTHNPWIQTLHVRLQFNNVLSRVTVCKNHLPESVLEDTKDVNSDPSWGKESSCDGTGAAATTVQIQSCFLDDNHEATMRRSKGSRIQSLCVLVQTLTCNFSAKVPVKHRRNNCATHVYALINYRSCWATSNPERVLHKIGGLQSLFIKGLRSNKALSHTIQQEIGHTWITPWFVVAVVLLFVHSNSPAGKYLQTILAGILNPFFFYSFCF